MCPKTNSSHDLCEARSPTKSYAIHNLGVLEATRVLESNVEHGLSVEEVMRRQQKFGANRIVTRHVTPGWRRFLKQFTEPLIYVLIAAAAITAWLGEYVDASIIFGVVLVNAIIGFIQESKAEGALDALMSMVTTETTVRRGGTIQRVPSTELVPGDVVILEAGDRVPADLRLFQVKGLHVDESALTGESLPAAKHPNAVAHDAMLGDRESIAFTGTLVTAGRGEGLVWAIGDKTESGRIAWLIAEATELSTPLTRKIAQFSRLLLWVILMLGAITFAIGVARGKEPVEMFMAAIALAVGVIPEGLPAAVTVVLAIGVTRMAKRHAIIRKLPAVETLGSTTVICSDKTGTLTENAMTVQDIFAGGRSYIVSGNGYKDEGDIRLDGQIVMASSSVALGECLEAGLLCNDSQLREENGAFLVQGDPTEAALIVAARKGGLLDAELHRIHPRLDSIPFESEHQFMATLHRGGHVSPHIIYKKGAVERMLERCTSTLHASGEAIGIDKAQIRHAAEQMASRGLRVLAFARGPAAGEQVTIEHHHVAGGLTFLGLQGMMDPPRPEAIAAVAKCQSAGVTVKMITGDHAGTARAIGQKIGIAGSTCEVPPVTGRELKQVSDADLPPLADRTAIFARVAPEQKLRLVRALQARGHIVAMTGDGVNDAPALKQADIGIAMGISGTDVAKGAAAMVLTDDNFATIEAAVEEGRGVFDNLTKFIVWTLPTSCGQALILLSSILLGFTLPTLPIQLLWVNLATSLFLGMMLVFEPKEDDLMQRAPRDPKMPILTHALILRTGLVSIVMLAGALWLFFFELHFEGHAVEMARTAVINVVVIVEIGYLFNCRSLHRSVRTLGIFSNRAAIAGAIAMIGVQLFFTYTPLMHAAFHTAAIDLGAWVRIAAVSALSFTIVEVEKWLRRSKVLR
jgi:cation-transporting P-type ATPase F